MVGTPASLSRTLKEQSDANVADILIRAARRHTKRGILIASADAGDQQEFISYPALLQEAQAILGGLQARVEHPRGRVALILERPKDFVPAFWACLLGGYVPCPIAPILSDVDRWEKHLAHVNSLLEGPLFVCSDEYAEGLSSSFDIARLCDLRKNTPGECVRGSEPQDTALLMLTSGSTGHSKAVELSHSNLLASMAGRAEMQQLTSSDTTFNWIAFDHVAALLESHMIALYVGATQLHAQPAVVLADPLQFLRLIDLHHVTVAFAPNFLLGQINSVIQALLSEDASVKIAVDLSCLRRIVTGGEANVVETGRRFLELFALYGLHRCALWPAFGMTETCAASVYSQRFPDGDADREFAAVGVPIRGLELRIVDEIGKTCPVGTAGELQLRGSMIFRRYLNNEVETCAAFTADGWFRTGDVGRIDDDQLRLVARNKDSIIVSGVNYYSHELETRLEEIDGVDKSYVAAFPIRPKGADTEQLVIAIATTIPETQEERLHQLVVAIRNTIIMLWGFRPALILPLPRAAFPKTSLGKIQRSLMRKRLEAGDYESHVKELAELTKRQAGSYVAPNGDLEIGIVKVFADILHVESGVVSATASFFDLGGTSLDILRLARALQRFGLKATIPLVLQNPTARQLAARASSGTRQSVAQYSPIVPLQTTGKKLPLFCVHPGNGEVFVLVNLAKYFLNDRPFYALRPRGFNEGEQRFTSVAEMVGTYVDAILEIQPQGPYAIAGYSLGGVIAFEVAQELEVRGHSVKFLSSIDGRPLHQVAALSFNLAVGLALVTDLITKEQSVDLHRRFGPKEPDDEMCEYILGLASPERLTELDLDLPKFSAWARVAHTVESLLFNHRKSGSVKAMTIFCSAGMSTRYSMVEWTRQTWREQELQHWEEHVERPKYVEIAGHHHTLMSPKHVASFQAALRREIDLALNGR